MKKELIVVQRNSFIRGDFSNLEIRDMKILKLLVSKVNATGDKFNDYYSISKDEVRLCSSRFIRTPSQKYSDSLKVEIF